MKKVTNHRVRHHYIIITSDNSPRVDYLFTRNFYTKSKIIAI